MLADVPEAEGTFLDCGLQFFRSGGESGNYFRSAEAVFAAQGRGAHRVGDCEPRSSAAVWGFRSDRVCRRCRRRFRDWDSSADSSSWCRIRRRTNSRNWPAATQGLMRQASQRKDLVRLFSVVYRERSAISGDDRSREGEEPARAAVADHRHAGRLHGFVVRERFRFQQPLVPGVCAGGQAVPGDGERHRSSFMCAPTAERWCRWTT